MPRRKDPEAHTEERRAQILRESARQFSERGYHATNIADIARGLGLGHGTFYRYFRNKLDIFEAVVDDIVGQVGQVLAEERPAASATLEEYRAQLERIGARLAAIFLPTSGLVRLVLHEGPTVDPAVGTKIRGLLDYFASYTQAYLENGKARGFLRADLDTEVTARAINAMILASLEDVVRSDDPRRREQRWQQAVIRLMLDGMRRR